MSDRVMIISSDCHGGPRSADYRPYLETQYHEALDQYLAEQADAAAIARASRAGMHDRELRVKFGTEMDSRLGILEADGIVGEVIFPDGTADNSIPFTGLLGGSGGRYSVEHQTAGQRAYNRWLGEHCDPDRQIGLGLIPMSDPEGTLAEVQKVRGYGLRGIYPIFDGGDRTPQLYDPAFDPMWASCADDGLTVNFHVGSGMPMRLYDSKRGRNIFRHEVRHWARRALWHMILGGVFERHPRLRVGFTELQADWIPVALGQMDEHWDAGSTDREICPLRPSDYWRRQGFIGASAVSRYELEIRDELGVEAMMFGTDHAHSVATWGCTTQYLQLTMGAAAVTEADARAILGENIAKLYDLDVAKLESIAERVGPTIEDVLAKPTSETIEAIPEYLRSSLQELANRGPGNLMKPT